MDDVSNRCGGVLIENQKYHDLPPSKEKQVDLKTLRFVPRFQSNIDVSTCTSIITTYYYYVVTNLR